MTWFGSPMSCQPGKCCCALVGSKLGILEDRVAGVARRSRSLERAIFAANSCRPASLICD